MFSFGTLRDPFGTFRDPFGTLQDPFRTLIKTRLGSFKSHVELFWEPTERSVGHVNSVDNVKSVKSVDDVRNVDGVNSAVWFKSMQRAEKI